MPNISALVGESATGVAFEGNFPEENKSHVLELIRSFGKTVIVPEKLIDAITGLSGSGPTYVLAFIDALTQAGIKQGLTYQQALELAIQTVIGTAKFLMEKKEHPMVLVTRVTSPGGTTIYGLHELERGKFKGTIMNAVEAATQRSRALSEEMSKKFYCKK